MPQAHSPKRVVSLQPSVTVTMKHLRMLDRLVACTKYCADVCPEVSNYQIEIVHDSWTAQQDQILAVNPDLVIASVPYQEKAVIEILKAGVAFLGLAPHTLEDVYSDMVRIAGIMGEPVRGEQIVTNMKNRISATAAKTASAKFRPRVFCEEWGKPIIQSQPWVAELVKAAGGEFIGVAGREISADTVKAVDPDVIIAAWCGAAERVPLEKIIEERGWGITIAAKTRQVYCVRDEYLNTPAPTLLEGLAALAYAIHPEIFSSVQGIRRMAEETTTLAAG